MGDALMQVLDLAEHIQAGGRRPPRRRRRRRAASPRIRAPSPIRRLPRAPPSTSPTSEPLVAAILLSDGANSVGEAEPLDAAERAAALGVPIYTIALGTAEGRVKVEDQSGQPVTLDVPPDTETLAQIAEITGATAFDAPTADDLSRRLRQPRVARRLDRGAAGGHVVVRRRAPSSSSSSPPGCRRLVRAAALEGTGPGRHDCASRKLVTPDERQLFFFFSYLFFIHFF